MVHSISWACESACAVVHVYKRKETNKLPFHANKRDDNFANIELSLFVFFFLLHERSVRRD